MVNDVDLDATDNVVKANTFNPPPPPGQRYILVNVTVTFQGGGTSLTSDLATKVRFSAYGLLGVQHFTSRAVVPVPLDVDSMLQPGAEQSGNLTFIIEAGNPIKLRAEQAVCATNCLDLWWKLTS